MRKHSTLLLIAFLLAACTSTLTSVQTWGSKGNGPGQFNGAFDVAVDQDGFVYVADAGNRRIQKFDSNGKFILAFGRKLFERPSGIGIAPDGSIWVTDFNLGRVFHFNNKGKLLVAWGKEGNGPGDFDVAADVAVDSKGFIYVVDEYRYRVRKFTPDGHCIRSWGEKGKVNVFLSAIDFLLPEMAQGKFSYPSRIAIGPRDKVYVSDTYNNRVQVFDTDGHWLQSIGGLGLWGGRFRVAAGISVARDGSLFVGDFYNNRIQHFDKNGHFLTAWGEGGSKPGQFSGPTGVATGPQNNVYVADWGNHRIQRFPAPIRPGT
jgi:DNA-binding beta-propeller fold protein YncE